MIVIEGPDNSGKTYLGEHLCRQMQIEYNHSMGPFQTKKDLMVNMGIIARMAKNQKMFIQDRYPLISEAVYQPILRPDKLILDSKDFADESPEVIMWNEHRMDEFFIVCMPPKKVVTNIQTEQPQAIKDNIGEIYDSYDILVNNLWNHDRNMPEVVNLFVYDYTQHWQWIALQRCIIQWIRSSD